MSRHTHLDFWAFSCGFIIGCGQDYVVFVFFCEPVDRNYSCIFNGVFLGFLP